MATLLIQYNETLHVSPLEHTRGTLARDDTSCFNRTLWMCGYSLRHCLINFSASKYLPSSFCIKSLMEWLELTETG